jgi:tRNA U34 5-methylaminomethyl-2-thiouridine-forming methyltransferase MnmC
MIEIIQTKDGSHTLKNLALNETYHSVHGALTESSHVFVRYGLEYLLNQNYRQLDVLEVGLGTGLNAWLTAKRVAGMVVQLRYTALETHPLTESVWSKLNYAVTPEDRSLFFTLHQAAWGMPVSLTANVSVEKLQKSAQEVELAPASIDLIYYDAFAPQKQPEMWTGSLLAKVARWLKPGGVLVTYCAKGQVKRDLQAAGLEVKTLPGPPGKREMIHARQPK